MNKIEIGTIVTIVIAIIAAAVAIGQLQGRISALEKDKDYSSLKKEIQTGLDLFKKAENEIIKSMTGEEDKSINAIDSLKKEVKTGLDLFKKTENEIVKSIKSEENKSINVIQDTKTDILRNFFKDEKQLDLFFSEVTKLEKNNLPNQVCRRAEVTASIDGKVERTYITACRDDYGSWKLQP